MVAVWIVPEEVKENPESCERFGEEKMGDRHRANVAGTPPDRPDQVQSQGRYRRGPLPRDSSRA